MPRPEKTKQKQVEQTRIAGQVALSVGNCNMPSPPGWAWVKLSEVARLESGHTPRKSHPEYWDGDVPWIGIPDARANNGKTIKVTLRNVTQAGIDNSAARLLPAQTVCLSRTASIGYVTVMGRPMATSQDFVNWVCSDTLNPYFLMYLFLAEGSSLRRFSKGSTHSTIYFPEAEAFYVCLPNVQVQRQIVTKLDDFFARATRLEQILGCVPELVTELRVTTLLAAFRGVLVTEDVEAVDANADSSIPSTELLVSCVRGLGGSTTPESLYRASKVGSVDEFYALLRNATDTGLLRVRMDQNASPRVEVVL